MILSAFTLRSYGVTSEVDTIYYDKNWNTVSNHHFADYYMIVEKNDVEGSPKRFRGFYITGELQSEGVVTHVDENNATKSSMGDGEYRVYYKNGHTQEIIHIKNGLPNGEYLHYYENGDIQRKGLLVNGKMEGIATEINEEGLCFQKEFKDGQPINDYFIVTNQDGLFSRIRTSDNSHLYTSPSVKDMKTTTTDGDVWHYYINDGVTVAINVDYTEDFGKYYRVYMVVTNKSFYPMEFNPYLTTAMITEKNGKQVALDIQSAEEYSKRIGRTQMWEEGIATMSENMNAKKNSYSTSATATIKSNGSASVSATKTYDAKAAQAAQQAADTKIANMKQQNQELRKSKLEGYVEKATINPGQTYSGYFNIQNKSGRKLEISISVGGVRYNFPFGY